MINILNFILKNAGVQNFSKLFQKSHKQNSLWILVESHIVYALDK